MAMETIRRTASASRSAFFGLIAAWRSWRSRQVNRLALETLSDDLLKDIGLRRLPAGPSRYESAGLQFAQPDKVPGPLDERHPSG
jgi:uncharacterized protein YjiS (DUF1127 family)